MNTLCPLQKFKILVGEIEALTPGLTLAVVDGPNNSLSVLPVVNNVCPSEEILAAITSAINTRLILNSLEEIVLQPIADNRSGFRIDASLKPQ